MSTVASEDRINGTASDSRSVVADLWSMDDMLSRLVSRQSMYLLAQFTFCMRLVSRYDIRMLIQREVGLSGRMR